MQDPAMPGITVHAPSAPGPDAPLSKRERKARGTTASLGKRFSDLRNWVSTKLGTAPFTERLDRAERLLGRGLHAIGLAREHYAHGPAGREDGSLLAHTRENIDRAKKKYLAAARKELEENAAALGADETLRDIQKWFLYFRGWRLLKKIKKLEREKTGQKELLARARHRASEKYNDAEFEKSRRAYENSHWLDRKAATLIGGAGFAGRRVAVALGGFIGISSQLLINAAYYVFVWPFDMAWKGISYIPSLLIHGAKASVAAFGHLFRVSPEKIQRWQQAVDYYGTRAVNTLKRFGSKLAHRAEYLGPMGLKRAFSKIFTHSDIALFKARNPEQLSFPGRIANRLKRAGNDAANGAIKAGRSLGLPLAVGAAAAAGFGVFKTKAFMVAAEYLLDIANMVAAQGVLPTLFSAAAWKVAGVFIGIKVLVFFAKFTFLPAIAAAMKAVRDFDFSRAISYDYNRRLRAQRAFEHAPRADKIAAFNARRSAESDAARAKLYRDYRKALATESTAHKWLRENTGICLGPIAAYETLKDNRKFTGAYNRLAREKISKIWENSCRYIVHHAHDSHYEAREKQFALARRLGENARIARQAARIEAGKPPLPWCSVFTGAADAKTILAADEARKTKAAKALAPSGGRP